MRTLVMGLNVGICREDEKCAKKQAMIGYVLKRLRVSISFTFKIINILNHDYLNRDINCTCFDTLPVKHCV